MLPAVPLFDAIWPTALLSVFQQRLKRAGGVFLEPPIDGDGLKLLRDKVAAAKVVCSLVPEIDGNCRIADVSSPAELPTLQLVIVRASQAVVETGSLIVDHEEPCWEAVLPFTGHLIVLLDPADIVVNLKHAFRQDEYKARNQQLGQACEPESTETEAGMINAGQGIWSLSVLPLARARAHPRTPA
jgi:L-lactate dehydrogenase complex protein LldG